MLNFTLHKKDGYARRATVELNHGKIETPVFMPVGTYGSVKAMTSQNLHDINVKIILVLRKGASFTLFRTIQLSFFDCIIVWQILLLIKNHVAFTVPYLAEKHTSLVCIRKA